MVKIKLKPTSAIILKLGLDANGDVQQFFTNTCALHMDKYVPFDTGALARTTVINGNINTGNVFQNAIVYNQEYARYVYYGISRSGLPMNYQKEKHPEANSYWDKRMWSAEKDIVVKEVQNYLDKRG